MFPGLLGYPFTWGRSFWEKLPPFATTACPCPKGPVPAKAGMALQLAVASGLFQTALAVGCYGGKWIPASAGMTKEGTGKTD